MIRRTPKRTLVLLQVVPTKRLLPRLLDLWNVEQSHKDKILSCKTPEELLEIGLPENLLDVLLDLRRPPTVGERMEERTLELPDASISSAWARARSRSPRSYSCSIQSSSALQTGTRSAQSS